MENGGRVRDGKGGEMEHGLLTTAYASHILSPSYCHVVETGMSVNHRAQDKYRDQKCRFRVM